MDRGLQATNPVWVVEQAAQSLDQRFLLDWDQAAKQLAEVVRDMVEADTTLPASILDRLRRAQYLPAGFQPEVRPRRSGVVGLVVVLGADLGLVAPLCCRLSHDGWHVDPALPFSAEAVQDALVRLLKATGLSLAGIVPESLAFTFTNPLGQRAVGNSMTVAALLAVLDRLSEGRSGLLSGACAVVEPDGDRLLPVAAIPAKLAGFLREHERGSLLVAPHHCPEIEPYRERFAAVWEVASFKDLADRLKEAGLLEPLLRRTALTPGHLQQIHDRLHWLIRVAHRYPEASDLGRRVQEAARAETAPAELESRLQRLQAEAARHLGLYNEATEGARRVYSAVQERGDLAGLDEEADAAAEYAAGLFDAHRFADIVPLLERWRMEIEQQPRRLNPQTRVKVLNTLGRTLVVLGRPAACWRPLFERSLSLQQVLDPVNVLRTTTYLLRGLLRQSPLAEAERIFKLHPLPERIESFSHRELCFLRADLARRNEQRWDHPWVEPLRAGQVRPGHPTAFYFQATARQPGRSDRCDRLAWAVALLQADAAGLPHNIASLFAHCLELYSASLLADSEAWQTARAAIDCFLSAPAAQSLRQWYAPVLDRLPTPPDEKVAESVLDRIPYF
jgi:hypothetical protein